MSDGRSRSPSYPSTPLPEAIDMIKKIHQQERTNAINREVAAKALGYSGISGRSATVLANLAQYGLLERVGKSEIRVSARAVEILYPDDEKSRRTALWEAAQEPELFQKIFQRFTDGHPSRNSLEAFLIKEGFTDAAIPSAIRAFQETFSWVENAIGSESHRATSVEPVDSQSNQQVERSKPMGTAQHVSSLGMNPGRVADMRASGAEVSIQQKVISLGGSIDSRKQADELIDMLSALKHILKDGDDAENQVEAGKANEGEAD